MDDLIAATLHDAKNSLNALLVWLDRAERGDGAAPIQQARQQVAVINGQLVELLALYREGKGSLRLHIADQDLRDYFDDLKCEWPVVPDQAAIRWPEDFPVPAWAFDGYQVKLVLFDALRNALRHARGQVDIRVAFDATEKYLSLTVADDGPGFPEQKLAAEQGKAMDASGSGLGLIFARLIAEHHRTPDGRQGRLEMKNAPTGGALFSFWLP